VGQYDATIGEILEDVFSTLSVPRYLKSTVSCWSSICTAEESIAGLLCFGGIKYGNLALQIEGISNLRQ
jgi:hypothetical protein